MYTKQAKAYTLLLMTVSPVLSLIYGLKNLDYRGKQLILALFGLFYGLLLNYTADFDAGSYARFVETYYYLGWDTFYDRFIAIITLSQDSSSPSDLYIHVLCGIAGSMFQSKTLLFGIVGLVYGYFYGRAILKVVNLSKVHKISITLFMLILLFLIHRSFDSMQTIRSWTGMWVLFNGVFSYHQTKKKKYLILILVSPFFHLMYGFIAIPALIVVVFQFIPKYVFIGIYVISFLVNINTLLIVDVASENDLAKSKLGSYYRIDKTGKAIDPIAQRKEESGSVWYAKYGKTTAVYAGATALIFFLILGGYYGKLKMNQVEYGLMNTGLLLASLANFLSFAYALYSRTMAVATIFILAVVVMMYLNNKIILNSRWRYIGLWLCILIFIPKVVYFASDFLYKTSMLLFVFPFANFLGENFNFSIRDTINLFRS